MTSGSEHDYFRMRHATEQILAGTTTPPEAPLAHRKMKDLYAALVAQGEQGSVEGFLGNPTRHEPEGLEKSHRNLGHSHQD